MDATLEKVLIFSLKLDPLQLFDAKSGKRIIKQPSSFQSKVSINSIIDIFFKNTDYKWRMIRVSSREDFDHNFREQRAPICIAKGPIKTFLNKSHTFPAIGPCEFQATGSHIH